ncbi:virulence protein SSD1-like [Pollicipes pollicipes]|uniref:virulence protein SSD1-like n=1 Tax=Pollicipes pollicipes TaxID=41117 RepID=UPI001884F6DE|nr:virulence protein SSD1-like [Pollicipes pollicipes]
MSCASFIHVNEGPSPRSLKTDFEDIEDHAALIGLQALTLNLASANRVSEEPEPRKKCLKPLSISTARKTPEKHVSISPLSVTPRSVGSSARSRPSPSRSDSSGFQSLPSPQSAGSDGSLGSGSGSVCWHRGRIAGDARVFTNHSNMEVKPSESLESINSRSASGSASRQRQTNSRSRQGTPQSRQGTPQSRQGTPQSRQSTPQPRHGTPHSRQATPQWLHGTPQRENQRTFEEYATIFDVQQGLKKGQLVEGVLRINAKSYKDAYISAPDGLTDIYVGGVRDRNRALHGDVVAVELRPQHEWKVLENALVTYLISNGTLSDLEILYETDANLQKNAVLLDAILPDRFPRPLRLLLAPGEAAAPPHDPAAHSDGPARAKETSLPGDDAPPADAASRELRWRE